MSSHKRKAYTNQPSDPRWPKSRRLSPEPPVANGSEEVSPSTKLFPGAEGRVARRTNPSSQSKPRRKRPVVAEAAEATEACTSPVSKRSRRKEAGDEGEEKRLRRFRDRPPQEFHAVYERALSQRFFVLSRERTGDDKCPGEVLQLAGSTGNVYTVHIERQPTCTCPHASRGKKQCKHVIYVLSKVLNAAYQLVYQLAFLSAELKSIFANAPPISSPVTSERGGDDQAPGSGTKRKPIEGDCGICFCELDASDGGEETVWCRAACGQNIHLECFETWARTKKGDVTCPYCRRPWEVDPGTLSRINLQKASRSEGYVNVAAQLGISPNRDESTYSPWFYQRRGVW